MAAQSCRCGVCTRRVFNKHMLEQQQMGKAGVCLLMKQCLVVIFLVSTVTQVSSAKVLAWLCPRSSCSCQFGSYVT